MHIRANSHIFIFRCIAPIISIFMLIQGQGLPTATSTAHLTGWCLTSRGELKPVNIERTSFQ